MSPAADESPQPRHRSLIVAAVLVATVIATGLLAGHSGPGKGGTKRPKVSFGAQVEQLGATSDLVYTNGWVASSGTHSIGVYAGSQRLDRRNGLFVILRATGTGSDQRVSRVVVHGSGAVTMLRPSSPVSEAAALRMTLRFVTANGATGTLDLADDRVSLSG